MRACNLIPIMRKERRRRRSLRQRWGVAIGLYAAVALGTSVYLVTVNNPVLAQASARAIQTIDQEQDRLRRELGQTKTQLVAARRQLDRANMIVSHPDFSPLLGLLARERRGEVVLESCNLRAGAVTSAQSPLDRRPQEYVLVLAGIAREAKGISAYAASLEATKAFDSVTIQEMRGRGDRTQERSVGFTLRCVLRESAAPGGKP